MCSRRCSASWGCPIFSTLAFRAGDATVNYGLFLNSLITFVLIAFAIFLFVVKPMNALAARRAGSSEGEPTTKSCPYCASDIAIAATRCPMCTSQLSESA